MTDQEAKDIHLAAMKIAQKAMLADMEKRMDDAQKLYEAASEMEKQVALSFLESTSEPTRSVLFRSAASLAMLCRRFDEAKELIRHGLSGNPPNELILELMELHAEVLKKEIDGFFAQRTNELHELMALLEKAQQKRTKTRKVQKKEALKAA